MTTGASAVTDTSEDRRPRPRGRRTAILTLLMAGAYVWAADLALHGGERWGLAWDGIRRINSTRIFLGTLMPGQGGVQDSHAPPMGGLSLFNSRPRRVTSEQRQRQLEQQRQVAAVEGLAYAWQRLMWILAAGLLAVAVLSWITPWGRFWHVLAGVGILLASVLTWVGLQYLAASDGGKLSIWPLSFEQYRGWLDRVADFLRARGLQVGSIPAGGGMGDPPLRAKVFVACLSFYGWLLLALFAFRRGAHSAPRLPERPA